VVYTVNKVPSRVKTTNTDINIQFILYEGDRIFSNDLYRQTCLFYDLLTPLSVNPNGGDT